LIYAIAVGFYINPSMKDIAFYLSMFFALNPIRMITYIDISTENIQFSSLALDYNLDNDMSVSINQNRHITLVGLPILNKVVQLRTNTNSDNYSEWTIQR
jgi:hypothetical protein